MTRSDDLRKRREKLSPKRRALLERLLRGEATPTKKEEALQRRFRPSFAQERLWFLHRMNPGLTAYNVAVEIRIRSPLDVERLQGCFATLIERHQALRLCFEEVDGAPMAVDCPQTSISIDIVDGGGDAADLARSLTQQHFG